MSDTTASAARRTYMREYKRKQRANARAKNLCLVCLKNDVVDKAVCVDCVTRSVEWERARGWRKKST